MFSERDFNERGMNVDLLEPVISMETTGFGIKTQSVEVLSGVWVSTSKLPVSSFRHHSLAFSFFRNPRPWYGYKSVSEMFISPCGQLLTEIKSEVVQSEMIILSLFNSLFKCAKVTTHILSSLGSQNVFIHLVHKGKNWYSCSPKDKNSVIKYSPSCRSKPVRPLLIFGTQIKISLMKSKNFLTLHRQQCNWHVQGPER